MDLTSYISHIKTTNLQLEATEATYRPHLTALLKTHIPSSFLILDEPSLKKQKSKKLNKPDFMVKTRTGNPVFYVETKDLFLPLNNPKDQEQFNRYKEALPQLIITNFADFEVYSNGNLISSFSLFDKTFNPNKLGHSVLTTSLSTFSASALKTTDPVILAKELALHTRALRDEILTVKTTVALDPTHSLNLEMKFIKEKLLPDLKDHQFADLYAQTIAYGCFSYRYYNPSTPFALSSYKGNNTLIKNLISNVTSKDEGYDKLKTHIQAITDILTNTDIDAISKALAKTSTEDLIIHFYETFLAEYDPKLRTELGIWYTPEPIVNYMVRGVDALLKQNFGLPKGLATEDKDGKGNHKVQILDPATGTGNFLNATIKYIGKAHEEEATWDTYVKEHLIPRLHGFEILMTSYSIAQLKLNNTLKETGFGGGEQKFNIFLTNTLQKPLNVKSDDKDLLIPFLKSLNEESNRADEVKTNSNIKVVIGNPPYNKKSKNQGKHIDDLLTPYDQKGSKGALQDDYIKFTRFAEKMIDDNGSGIVAYLSNNSFLSAIAMTNMRKSLLKSFDEIYVLDFTGDPKDNIFKIKQTVCITFFVKTSNSQSYASVFYKKVEGSREDKHNYCKVTSFQKTDFTKLNLLEPEYYFYPLDIGVKEEYTKDSFALDECFHVKGSGIKTNCDALVLDTRLQRLDTKIDTYFTKGDRAGASETVNKRKTKHSVTKKDGVFTTLPYRPFETKHYFDSDLTDTRSEKLRKHEKAENQVFLNFTQTFFEERYNEIFVTKQVSECKLFKGERTIHTAPLYQYTEATEYSLAIQTTNFTDALIETLKSKTKLKFEDNSELSNPQTFSSLDIMNYIYGWLHDTSYRAKYNDFLKSNYPRVPYPKNEEQFRAYMQKGRAFSEVHLSEGIGWENEVKLQGKGSLKIEGYGFDGSNLKLNSMVSTPLTQQEWDFKIGACKVIDSWLSYRAGDDLNTEEVVEFKRMVARVRRHLKLI